MKKIIVILSFILSLNAKAENRYSVLLDGKNVVVVKNDNTFEFDFSSNVSRNLVFASNTRITKSYCNHLQNELSKSSDVPRLEVLARKYNQNDAQLELLGFDWEDANIRSDIKEYFSKTGVAYNDNLLELSSARDFKVEIKAQPDALSRVLGLEALVSDLETQLVNNHSLKSITLNIKANDLACDLLNKKVTIVIKVLLSNKEYFSKPLLTESQLTSVANLMKKKSDAYISEVSSFWSSPSVEDKNLFLVSALALALKEAVKMEPTDIGSKNYSELSTSLIDYGVGSVRRLSRQDLQALAEKIGSVDSKNNNKTITINVQ